MAEFGATTTADEVLEGKDLSGKTAFITGGYSGLGQETARAMAAKGAHIIIAGRDIEKANAAAATADERVEQAKVVAARETAEARHPRFEPRAPRLGLGGEESFEGLAPPLGEQEAGELAEQLSLPLGEEPLAARAQPKDDRRASRPGSPHAGALHQPLRRQRPEVVADAFAREAGGILELLDRRLSPPFQEGEDLSLALSESGRDLFHAATLVGGREFDKVF